MKKYFKKTTSIALISLCGLSLTGLAMAMPSDGDNMMKRGHFQLEREYTLTEINTLVEAKLLRSRNAEKTLESIEKTKVGTFLVQISNASGDDKSIELNKFGTPVDAPLPGLFGKQGGKHGKGGKFNRGQWAQNEHKQNRQDGMSEGKPQFMTDKMAMNDEQKQAKRDAFIKDNALTLDEVTTLAQAKIIRLNNDKLKLGEVSNNDEGGYTVTILSTNNDLVSRIKLNEAGFPEFKNRHHKG
ncbi:hypothetical protein A9Q77_11280 [Marinomonas sp. 42_23_T18]|nr:hypothetical protein A9Q77_11280 [Marinomonas sp. 42_23_T18]